MDEKTTGSIALPVKHIGFIDIIKGFSLVNHIGSSYRFLSSVSLCGGNQLLDGSISLSLIWTAGIWSLWLYLLIVYV